MATLVNEKKDQIQQQVLSAIDGRKRAGAGVSMGVGKTLIGLKDMFRLLRPTANQRFLVVAPKTSIFESWKKDAVDFGMKYLLDRIDFSTYKSLHKQSLNQYQKVYLDECHSLLYSHEEVLKNYNGDILGLTGTPPRHHKSEKGIMVRMYCPIVFEYLTDTAIDEGVLNDYRIIIHPVELDTRKNLKIEFKNGGRMMTSEREHYEYWTSRIEKARLQGASFASLNMMRIQRLTWMKKYPSKVHYTRQLIEIMNNEKLLVFANYKDQAEALSDHCYYSGNAKSMKNLELFNNGDIDLLACVNQLNEGINIKNLRHSIIMHAYANERSTSQRLGRLLRLNPDDRCTAHILMYQDSIDEHWVQQALEGFDSSKIFYSETLL